MKKRILIPGGAGFLGHHIVNECISQGHEVIIIDNLSTGKIENVNPQAQFHKLDIVNEVMVEEKTSCKHGYMFGLCKFGCIP